MPALIILALWTALLGPGVVRWVRAHRPTTSIATFHRQLRQLERGPKLIAAAHRLDDGPASEDQPTRRHRERPQLVLLRTGANDKEHSMRYDGRDDRYGPAPRTHRRTTPKGRHVHVEDPYEDGWWDDPDELEAAPARPSRTLRAPVGYADDGYDDDLEPDDADEDATYLPRRRRHEQLTPARARTRRTRILAGIAGTIAGSFLLGLVPGLAILWAVTVLAVIALGMYLGLMYYASSTGMYGATDARRPIARVVMPAFGQAASLEDEEWAPERYAAAR